MNRMLVVPAVLMLLTAGCAAPAPSPRATDIAPEPSSASDSATPPTTTLPAGKFKLTTISGADITFTLPTPATDPAVKALETYRKKMGGAPVSYLVADVDNRKGTKAVNMYMVSAFDAEGIQYTFSTVTDVIDLWKPTYQADNTYMLPSGKVISGDAGSPLSGEGVELYNANINDADVAERTKIILASTITQLPKEFARVSVQPSGGGEGEEAQPAS